MRQILRMPLDQIRRRPIFFLAVIFLVGLALVGFATSGSSTDANFSLTVEEVSLPVPILPAELQEGYAVERELIGRIEARRESPVGFERSGQLIHIQVEEGDRVNAGAVLARLDTARLDAQRTELIARLDQAKAALALAESTAKRVRQARELDAVASQILDEAEMDLQVKRATVVEAEAAIARVDVELRKSRLTAPFDALVAQRLADEGQVVDAGRSILHLLEETAPEARISIASTAITSLRPGDPHDLWIDDKRYSASIRAILPIRKPGTRSVDVLFTLDTDLRQVRSGDLVRLFMTRRIEEPGFWLPTSALTEGSRGLWAAYVAVTEPEAPQEQRLDIASSEMRSTEMRSTSLHRLQRRELELLHQEEDRVFVRGTLQPGEQVVIDGLHRLVPGQMVRVIIKSERGVES